MKIFTAFLNIGLLLLITTVGFSQTKIEKTLVKSFNLKGMDVVLLDLDGEVEVQEWNNSIMRVQMTISLENGTSSMLKSLVQVGRYNLTSSFTEDDMKIYAPSMNKEIKVRGKVLKENIVYTVFAPKDVIVKMAEESSTSADTPSTEPSSK